MPGVREAERATGLPAQALPAQALPAEAPSPGALSSEALVTAVRAHADRVHDLVRRLGCPPATAPAVVEAAALEAVTLAAAELSRHGACDLPELLGHWFAGAADRAERAGCRPATPGPAPTPEQVLLQDGLAAREPAARRALLLSDAYDLPLPTVAAGLQLDPDGALAEVARARLALLPDVYACDGPVPVAHLPAPHLPAPHLPYGALARLALGCGQRGEVRHARGCPACTDAVQAQHDVRALLAGLAVVGLPVDGREAALERIAVRARSVLPVQVAPVPTPRRVLAPAPVLMSLLVAVLLGVGLGALLSRPAPVARAQVRALPPVTAPAATPLPGDVARPPEPAPSTLVFTYPPVAPTRAQRPVAATTPATTPPPSTPAPVPTVLLKPAAGAPAAPIRVTGTGWVPGGTVQVVLLDPRGRATASTVTATVGAGGGFSATLPGSSPDLPPGSYAVQVTQGAVTARAAYVVGRAGR